LARREALWALKGLRDEPLPLFAAASACEVRIVAEIDEPSVALKPMTEGGEVVEPENPLALAAKIDALFHDSQLRHNLGESGRRYALSLWQEERVLKIFESLLLKVAGAPTSSIIENPAAISV